MGKKKRDKPKDAPFWNKGTTNGKTKSGKDEPFAMVYASLWKHPNYQKLHPRTQQLYDRMILECGGHRNFEFTRCTAKQYGFKSNSVLRKAIAELVDAGFIEVVSSGQNTRTASEYQFSMKWKSSPLDKCSLSLTAEDRKRIYGQTKDESTNTELSESKTD